MKKQVPIIVRHPPLRPDDDSVVEYHRLLAEGYRQWRKNQNLNVRRESERLRESTLKRLMSKARSVITSEAISQILGTATPQDGRKLAGNIRDQLSKFLYRDLVAYSGLPHRGRQRKLASRDERIFDERRKGSSWGEIAIGLKVSPHAVQAAHRRELHRRTLVCRDYPFLKDIFGRIGILLLEERPHRARDHKQQP